MSKTRHFRAATWGVLVLLALSGPAPAEEHVLTEFNIQAQPLKRALLVFSRQSNRDVLASSSILNGKTSAEVIGRMSPEMALEKLLEGTGLKMVAGKRGSLFVTANNQSDTSERTARQNRLAATSASASAERATGPAEGAAPSMFQIEGSIGGRVKDARTGEYLTRALVLIEDTDRMVTTDKHGRFRFTNLAPGNYTLVISYLGFPRRRHNLTLAEHESLDVEYLVDEWEDVSEEVVVVGTRAARVFSLNEERSAANSSSVVSVDKLGSFAGTTLADALRRVPGIAFKFDNTTGNGTSIMARGLQGDMNAITINGLHAPGGTRFPDISNLLVDSFDTVIVNKTLLPSHDSAGTGALVEIETKSPLDRGARYAEFRFEGGGKDKHFGRDVLVTGTLSRAFGERENFGVSTAVEYRDFANERIAYGYQLAFGRHLPLAEGGSLITSISEIDPRRAFPFEAGVDDAYVTHGSLRFGRATGNNLTVTASGEWRVADHTNVKIDLQRNLAKRTDFSRAQQFGVESIYQTLPVASLNGEVRSALTLNPDELNAQIDIQRETGSAESSTYSLRADTKIDNVKIDYTFGYARGRDSGSNADVVSANLKEDRVLDPAFVSATAADPIEQRIISIYGRRVGEEIQLPLLTDAGWAFFNDPSNYDLRNIRSERSGEISSDRYTAEVNAMLELNRAHFNYMKAGVRLDLAEFGIGRSSPTSYDVNSQFIFDPCCSSVFPELTATGIGLERVDLGDIGIGNTRLFHLPSRSDFANFMDNIATFTVGTDPILVLQNNLLHPDDGNQHTKEDNIAWYIESGAQFGKLEIVGGVRVNRVEVEDAQLNFPFFLDENFQPDPNFERQFTSLLKVQAVQTDIMPRIALNYRENEKLVFRGSYHLSVARPALTQLAQAHQISLILFDCCGPLGNQPGLFVQQGNPDLKPAITHNADLSVEHYHDRLGVMKISAFYKHINNLLEETVTQGTAVFDGLALPDHPYFRDLPDDLFVEGSLPVNSPYAAYIWGIEGQIERRFFALPGWWSGFGVFANATYTESSKREAVTWSASPVFDGEGNIVGRESVSFNVRIPFDSQPKYSGTAAVTYNRSDIDAVLAYSFQGRGHSPAFNSHNLNQFRQSSETLDLHVEYRRNVGAGTYRFYLDAEDLLRGPRQAVMASPIGGVGPTPTFNSTGTFLGGRRFKVGFAAAF